MSHGGDEDAVATLGRALAARIAAFRSDRELAASYVEMIVTYLVGVAKVSDADQLIVGDLLDYAKEAWANENDGGKLPGIHARAIAAYLNKSSSVMEDHSFSSAKEDEEGEETEQLFGKSGATKRELKMLREDIEEQGISGMRIVCLSVALELGAVPSNGDVAGTMFYGSDPRISDIVKRRRKAGIATLSKLLESSKDVRRDVNAHISALIRDYSDRGLLAEASRINRVWIEAQAVCPTDKHLVEYFLEYLKKYPGRGLPVIVDTLIVARVCSQGSGPNSSELRELKEALKTIKDEAKTAKTESSNLRNEVTRLRVEAQARRQPTTPGEGPICHKCGERGHIARNCPRVRSEMAEGYVLVMCHAVW